MSIGGVGSGEPQRFQSRDIHSDISIAINDLQNYVNNLGKGSASQQLLAKANSDVDAVMGDIQNISPPPQGIVESVFSLGMCMGMLLQLGPQAAAGDPVAISETHAAAQKASMILSSFNALLD
jgi:hypothetical protein